MQKATWFFSSYLIFLILFAVNAILPQILDGIIFSYVEPRTLLMLKTEYKGRMLKKLKTLKYEHLENESSAEIIDKAYNRADNSARHLFPIYDRG